MAFEVHKGAIAEESEQGVGFGVELGVIEILDGRESEEFSKVEETGFTACFCYEVC